MAPPPLPPLLLTVDMVELLRESVVGVVDGAPEVVALCGGRLHGNCVPWDDLAKRAATEPGIAYQVADCTPSQVVANLYTATVALTAQAATERAAWELAGAADRAITTARFAALGRPLDAAILSRQRRAGLNGRADLDLSITFAV